MPSDHPPAARDTLTHHTGTHDTAIQNTLTQDTGITDLTARAKSLLPRDPAAALQLAAQALTAAQHTDDLARLAEVLQWAGTAHQLLGQHAQAFEQYWKAAALYEADGDPSGQARCTHRAAIAHLSLGRYADALERLETALQLAQGAQDRVTELAVLDHIEAVHRQLGQETHGHVHLDWTLGLRRELGDPSADGPGFNNLGAAHLDLGCRHRDAGETDRAAHEFQFALELFAQALTSARDHGDEHLTVCALRNVSLAHTALGDADAAQAALELAQAGAQKLGDHDLHASVTLDIGQLLVRTGNPAAARPLLQGAVTWLQASGARQELARAELALSELHEAHGDHHAALTHHKRHLTLVLALRAEAAEHRARAAMARLELERARAATERLERQVQRRTTQLQEAQVEMLELLAGAAEFRDAPLGPHIQWVGDATALVAARLGLKSEDVAALRLAARLHDIGKIAIPDGILLKAAKLDPDEWEIMRAHTTMGAQMLERGASPLLRLAGEIALSHHEHWDGNGYPTGLAGTGIPIGGRIVSVVDTFDALVSERPYKDAWPEADAVKYLREGAGTRFDPDVVRAFLAIHESGELPPRHAGV